MAAAIAPLKPPKSEVGMRDPLEMIREDDIDGGAAPAAPERRQNIRGRPRRPPGQQFGGIIIWHCRSW